MNSMYRTSFLILIVVFFTGGCTTIRGKNRMSGFEKVSRTYERIMLDSDFETAHGFTNPESVREEMDLTAYKGIKIVEYQVKKGWASDNKIVVNQTVEVKYYRINSLIVRTMRYEQLWKYDDMKKTWLLQTGLPELK
jgi:hypothetical protein